MTRPAAHLLGLGLRHANLPSVEDWQARLQWAMAEAKAEPLAPLAPLPPEQRLPASSRDLGRYGIPPIYRASIQRIQIHLLELAEQALAQAEQAGVALDREHCDVILVTALGLNRSHENEARAAAMRWAARAWSNEAEAPALLALWRQHLEQVFLASSHDKVGEMASALAARVAAHFRLRGRVLALESQEQGGVEALSVALNCLAQGPSRQVLILGAQTVDGPLPALTGRDPSDWRESACALLLGAPVAAHASWPALTLHRTAPSSEPSDHSGPQILMAGRSLPVRELLGYGHAMQDLQALALGCLALDQTQGGPLTVQQGSAGPTGWRIDLALTRVPADAGSAGPAEPAIPIAVLGCGSAYGDTRGVDQFWKALCEPGHRFRALDPQRHHCDTFFDPQARHSLAYYIDRASHALLPEDVAGHAASLYLARTAAEEAWGTVLSLAPERLGRLMVVCASNLSLPAARGSGAQALVPKLLDSLKGLAQQEAWPAERTQALSQGLRLQALGECSDCAADASLMTASGLGRAMVGDMPARVLAVEAACASSMAALELACLALRAEEVDCVLVLGVETPVNSSDLLLCSAQRMLAPELMASFGSDASGFTPGDGAGAVLLMRKPQAESLGLPMRAQLLAVGACTDSKSIIAPNQLGQTLAMRRAFEALAAQNIGPASLQYVETHGTGTLIGDQVETASLAEVYAGATQGLALGALKSKFGHCFAAAGMASLIKTVLALEHELMPANHFERPLKPELDWPRLGLDPLFTHRPWPRGQGTRRRAGINAFGTGGINYHLVLEEA